MSGEFEHLDPSELERRFQFAVDYIKQLPQQGPLSASTRQKLELYGLFKQATEGDCNVEKPSIFYAVARAKWSAWDRIRGTSKHSAMARYLGVILQFLTAIDYAVLDTQQTRDLKQFVSELKNPSANASNASNLSVPFADGASGSFPTSTASPALSSPAASERFRTLADSAPYSIVSMNGSSSYVETKADPAYSSSTYLSAPTHALANGRPSSPLAGSPTASRTSSGSKLSMLQSVQDENRRRLIDLETRLSEIVTRTLARTQNQPASSSSSDSQVLREELNRLAATLEDRLRVKKAEQQQAEAKWQAQLQQIERMHQQLLQRMQRQEELLGQGTRRSSSFAESFANSATLVIPIGIAGYFLFKHAKERGW